MSDLRSRLIRVAATYPKGSAERQDLLTALSGNPKEAGFKEILEGLWKSYKKEHPKSKAPPESLKDQAQEKAQEQKDKEPKKEEPKKNEAPEYDVRGRHTSDPKYDNMGEQPDDPMYHWGSLRTKLIRLAHMNPELRPHLLPLLQGRRADQAPTLHLPSKAALGLWGEMLAQMVDGAWENSMAARDAYVALWSRIPISIGGPARVDGVIPDVRKDFAFDSPMMMGAVGDRMLETVQETEPNATLKDVARYLKDIKLALKNAEVRVAPVVEPWGGFRTLPKESEQRAARDLMLKVCFDAAGVRPVDEKDVVAEAFLFANAGSRAGQYHYFVILESGPVCSAYGKFGKTPKGVLLGNSEGDLNKAKKLVASKARSKISSGYAVTALEGIKKSLNPVSGAISNS